MYGTPLFQSAARNALLYEHEMIVLACILLARAGRHPEAVAARWCTVPPREDFCPVWRIEHVEEGWLLRVRPRGTLRLLEALFERYRSYQIDVCPSKYAAK